MRYVEHVSRADRTGAFHFPLSALHRAEAPESLPSWITVSRHWLAILTAYIRRFGTTSSNLGLEYKLLKDISEPM